MDKQTLILELIGLSRVVNSELRDLIYKRHVVTELADDYEPENPFLAQLDKIEAALLEVTQHNIYTNLSKDERRAFVAQWDTMLPHEQFRYLDQYVRGPAG